MSTLLYISVILTVLSLILTVMAYYGLIRYCRLRYGPDCKCISEKYVNLPRVESKSKVIVSMYAPDTADLAKNTTLKSILDQTVHPDQIVIVTNTDVPEFLRKDSIITKQSPGALDKVSSFMVPLHSQKTADTKIIIITDGVVYGPDFIESIVVNIIPIPSFSWKDTMPKNT